MKSVFPILAAALLVAPAAAQAERLVGLSGGNSLVMLDSALGVVGGPMAIAGLGGDTLVGIDLRPTDKAIYGLAASGALYRIDRTGGSYTATGLGSITTSLNGSNFEIDFNPVPNRLRVVSNANQSLRLNVDAPAAMGGTNVDGSFAYPGGDAAAIVAAAYANNVAGATTTTFYALDAAQNRLVTVSPPNVGTLTNPVALSFTIGAADPVGFDISGRTGLAYVSAAGNLHRLDLATGTATVLGSLGALPVTDITALGAVPEPSSWAMLIAGFGLTGSVLRRRASPAPRVAGA